jgi:transketolase
VAIRLAIGPSPRRLELGGEITVGRGTILHEGTDALLFAYGPVMLHEALTAAEVLRAAGVRIAVADMPWLHLVDPGWLEEAVGPHGTVVVVEDHAPFGALGDTLRAALGRTGLDQGRSLHVLGVEGWPACGTPPEALRAHGLDGASLAVRIEGLVRTTAR